jgi:hypothetical protein
VLAEEKHDEIGAGLEYSTEKFPRHIAYETGVSIFMFIYEKEQCMTIFMEMPTMYA